MVKRLFRQDKSSNRSKNRVRLLAVLRILAYTPLFLIFLIISLSITRFIVADSESRKNTDEQAETVDEGSLTELENSQSRVEPASPQYSTHSVIPVAFSPNNQILASGRLDNTIRLSNLKTRKVDTLTGHQERIFSVAFSPDGKMLASGSADNSVRLWNIETKQEITTLIGHQERIISVAFSPDGKILASGSGDNTVRLWNTETKQEIVTLAGHSNIVTSVAFSPDGKLLASGSWDNTVKLYDVANKEIATLRGHSDGVNSVAFSSDGRVLASGSDDTIKLWNVETKQEITTEGIKSVPSFTTVENEVPDFSGGAESLVFSPHGMILASSYRGSIKLWNAKTRKSFIGFGVGYGSIVPTQSIYPTETIPDGAHPYAVQSTPSNLPSSIAFSSDGKLLAIGSEGYLEQTFDTKNGKVNVIDRGKFVLQDIETKVGRSLTGHLNGVTSVAFSPDGTTLASGSKNRIIKLWNVETKQEIATLGHGVDTNSVAFSVDGINSVAFSPDGKLLASGSSYPDNDIKLWNVETKQEIATFTGHSDSIYSVAFSPDGTTLASGSRDNTIKLWNVETKQEIATFTGHLDNINSVAFSPDGTTLASGSYDNTIKLWNVETKQEIATFKGHSDAVCSVAFSPDGKLLASVGKNDDSTIKLWDVETKQEITTFTTSTFYEACSIAFSPDGTTLADSDGTIQLWNVKTKQKVGSIDPQNQGHYNGTIYSIAFSPDGKTLATGSGDATIILWDAETETGKYQP